MDSYSESGEMQPFTVRVPTRIAFGPDTASGAGNLVKKFEGKKTFIVTDANLIKVGVLAPIFASLKQVDLPEPLVFDQVPPDSDLSCVTSRCPRS